MLGFTWPWLLVLLPLPFILKKWLFKQEIQSIQGAELQLPGIASNSIISSTNKKLLHLPYYIMWFLLVIAASRPQWLGDPIDIPTKGRDLMVAVDLSGSMQIKDMQINGKNIDRFSVVKQIVSDFIDKRKGDRLGLILFADHAYLQAPLTPDRRSVAQYLKEAQIGLVGKQTSIGEAIALAVKRFDKVKKSNRVLILVTDGSNNSGSIEPLEAAKIAAKRHMTIYTIGVGADVLLQRSIFGTQQINPSADLDEKTLTEIATITNGKYFRARDPQELQQIYRTINKLEPISRDPLSYRPKDELFYIPLALALLISLFIPLNQFGLFNHLSTMTNTIKTQINKSGSIK